MLELQLKRLLFKYLYGTFKKLVLILIISAPVTKTSKKMILKQFSYIYYLVWFKINKIQALINLCNKINVIIPIYATKLGSKIYFINVRA